MRLYGTLFANMKQVPIILTTEHSASSYGIPVVISGILDGRDGTPYGVGELWKLADVSADTDCLINLHGGQAEVTDDLRSFLIAAGFPLRYRTAAEQETDLNRIAEGLARQRIAHDEAIHRGEVDW